MQSVQVRSSIAWGWDSENGRGTCCHVMESIKAERVPDLIIDWVEKIGHERGIRYQFQIDLLSY